MTKPYTQNQKMAVSQSQLNTQAAILKRMFPNALDTLVSKKQTNNTVYSLTTTPEVLQQNVTPQQTGPSSVRLFRAPSSYIDKSKSIEIPTIPSYASTTAIDEEKHTTSCDSATCDKPISTYHPLVPETNLSHTLCEKLAHRQRYWVCCDGECLLRAVDRHGRVRIHNGIQETWGAIVDRPRERTVAPPLKKHSPLRQEVVFDEVILEPVSTVPPDVPCKVSVRSSRSLVDVDVRSVLFVCASLSLPIMFMFRRGFGKS
ncbi:Protein of unknown function [Pyronema omphalodes CBS 100304]|uniref:Uncharacterized protein n=1 Tax=Pyronema omphalodes (strain CBS 100304) TaxID=1076935 RepID=U4LHN1_PYROM|nr:Protein of unknown function [Pyronema omphalodes CBS 100304]